MTLFRLAEAIRGEVSFKIVTRVQMKRHKTTSTPTTRVTTTVEVVDHFK
jgi:hypothetical protein